MDDSSNLSENQDMELVALLKDGSHKAFDKLYSLYKDKLIHYLKQFLNDKTEAEDIVHDVFMQLWETRCSLNITSSFSGYLYTSAKNRIISLFRQHDVHSRFAQHILMNVTDSTNETEDLIIDNDYTALLNELIDSLPPKQKEIFRLNRIEGLTYEEIADMLQISVENVRNQISIASKKIKGPLLKHTNINIQSVIIILILLS